MLYVAPDTVTLFESSKPALTKLRHCEILYLGISGHISLALLIRQSPCVEIPCTSTAFWKSNKIASRSDYFRTRWRRDSVPRLVSRCFNSLLRLSDIVDWLTSWLDCTSNHSVNTFWLGRGYCNWYHLRSVFRCDWLTELLAILGQFRCNDNARFR